MEIESIKVYEQHMKKVNPDKYANMHLDYKSMKWVSDALFHKKEKRKRKRIRKAELVKKITNRNAKEAEFEVNPKNILPVELQYKSKQYTGELQICNYLIANNIRYKREYTFEDCKDIKLLRFDFAIFKDNEVAAVIEYNGIQHYKPVKFSKSVNAKELLITNKRHDNIKEEYCKRNNITLIKIKYTEQHDIDSILDKKIKNLKV